MNDIPTVNTFAEFSTVNHRGIRPSEDYLREQAAIIGEYFLRGNAALDSRASDETISYCHSLAFVIDKPL